MADDAPSGALLNTFAHPPGRVSIGSIFLREVDTGHVGDVGDQFSGNMVLTPGVPFDVVTVRVDAANERGIGTFFTLQLIFTTTSGFGETCTYTINVTRRDTPRLMNSNVVIDVNESVDVVETVATYSVILSQPAVSLSAFSVQNATSFASAFSLSYTANMLRVVADKSAIPLSAFSNTFFVNLTLSLTDDGQNKQFPADGVRNYTANHNAASTVLISLRFLQCEF